MKPVKENYFLYSLLCFLPDFIFAVLFFTNLQCLQESFGAMINILIGYLLFWGLLLSSPTSSSLGVYFSIKSIRERKFILISVLICILHIFIIAYWLDILCHIMLGTTEFETVLDSFFKFFHNPR
jgi:hypothetical protein